MATYIPNITDYIPQLQSFKPDLNFYSQVLQTKQSQFDSAHKAISQQYGTLVNSPMLRDTNIQRRDQFFKTIQQDVKKISGMDLSKEENVNAAMEIFRPVYEDKYILKDMAYTKQLQTQMGRAEAFRNCIDPDKCGGAFWEEGVRAMNYQVEEFKNATDDKALGYTAPIYTPFVNLTQKAIKAAKEAGFNVSVDTKKGGYIVTDTNGELLLNGSDGKAGILPNYLYGLFANDQKTMDVFKTQAYVARKDWSKQHAFEYGDENAAESAYLNKIISESVPKLQKQAAVSKEGFDELDATKTVLENKIKQDGGVLPGSTEENSYNLLNQLLASKPAADKYHEDVLNTVETAKNLQDIDQLRNRADAIIANGLFQDTVWNAAKEYAMGTKKTEAKADPYSLAKFNSQLELSNALTLKKHDFDIWKKKEDYENASVLQNLQLMGITPEGLSNLGLTPQQLAHLSPTQLKELKSKGAFESATGKKAALIGPTGGVNVTTGYDQNRKVYNNQAQQVIGNSISYLKEVANTMKSAYDARKFDNSDTGKKEKILLENKMKEVFKGTDFSVDDFLNGSIAADEIDSIRLDSVVKSFDVAINLTADPTTYYWSGNLLSQAKELRLKAVQDRQVFSKMGQLGIQAAQKVMKDKFADLKTKYENKDLSVEDYAKKITAFASILDANTTLRDPKSAAKHYVQKAAQYYEDDALAGKYNRHTGAVNSGWKNKYQKAEEDFLKRGYGDTLSYEDTVQEFKDSHNNSPFVLGGFAGSGAGSSGTPAGMSWQVDPSKPYDPKVKRAEAVVESVLSNIDSPDVVVYRSGVKSAAAMEDDPARKAFAMNYLSAFKDQLGEHKTTTSPSFELTGQLLSDMKYQTQVPFLNIPMTKEFSGGVLYKFSPNPATVKSMLGKTYDANADYSFVVKMPSDLDQSGFVQQTELTGTQMLLNIPGQGLSLQDKNKGNLTVQRTNNGYMMTGSIKGFNSETGTLDDIPVNSAPVPVNIDANNVLQYVQEYMDGNYNVNVAPYAKAYLNSKK